MVEVVISTMLVGVVLVGALTCVASVTVGRGSSSDAGKANQLASQLMAEIMACRYKEPIETPVFGREASESSTSRTNWDDVDDYHGWSASPPQDRNGNPLQNSAGWQREVVVEWIDVTNPSVVSGTDQGVKRITVTVRRDGAVLARAVALRGDK